MTNMKTVIVPDHPSIQVRQDLTVEEIRETLLGLGHPVEGVEVCELSDGTVEFKRPQGGTKG